MVSVIKSVSRKVGSEEDGQKRGTLSCGSGERVVDSIESLVGIYVVGRAGRSAETSPERNTY